MNEPSTFLDQAPESQEIAKRFPDLHPAFDKQAAVAEANRCLYCFDAPCTSACPTHIDVPRFIKKIASGNMAGSARTILDANILGESCARACPVNVLCEGACVMHRYNHKPIEIARLQRYAMDVLHEGGAQLPFSPGPDTGRSVALIGGGPASLACAAELRRHGICADIYDERELPGGLNTFGIAEYKLTMRASLREIEMLSQLGVNFHQKARVDAEKLAELEAGHDAVFLGVGLGAIHKLGIAGEQLSGVVNALDFIAEYKSGKITDAPKRVAVIGAGNTAIDAANAAVRLGATEVHMIYRRGPKQMSAFDFEYEHAQQEGVKFLWHRQPVKLHGEVAVEGIELQALAVAGDGSLLPAADETEMMKVDLVVLAIGQATHADALCLEKLKLERGRVVIDRLTGQTSYPKYFAGGDCVNGGREVVDAVADGKRAGRGIAAWLEAGDAHA